MNDIIIRRVLRSCDAESSKLLLKINFFHHNAEIRVCLVYILKKCQSLLSYCVEKVVKSPDVNI